MQPTNAVGLPEKLVSRIDFDAPDGCWQWTGALMRTGYGQFTIKRRHFLAHRVVYAELVGPIPAGMMIDHRCFNRACVNPEHLRAVTNKQNMEHLRGPNRDSSTGIRNVYLDKRYGTWRVQIGHNGKQYSAGTFTDLELAKAAAVALRARFFTHDDGESPRTRSGSTATG
jgi:hypothetical protein